MPSSSAARSTPSAKRSEKYHALFRSIPKNEPLKYSSSCLLSASSKYYQGRIYVGTEHICFSSKSLFGKASIIIPFKTVLAIELSTRLILQQCLSIITYECTYGFRGVSLGEAAYPIVLAFWRKAQGLRPSSAKCSLSSVFQVDAPRPAEAPEESTETQEERDYPVPIRQLIKLISSPEGVQDFYSTITDDPIRVATWSNRRSIEFANEFIDEMYSISGNTLRVDYHSRATLCRIWIYPISRGCTRVSIREKYNYTTNHYFEYIAMLSARSRPSSTAAPSALFLFFLFFLVLLGLRVSSGLFGLALGWMQKSGIRWAE